MKLGLTKYLFPAPADMVFIGTFLFVLWFGPFIANRDGDLGRHIAVGRIILETQAIPTEDPLMYTARERLFVPHEWLAEVLFAAAYEAGGFNGVALLTAIPIALVFAGLTRVMLRRGLSLLIVLPLVALGVLVSIAHWATRPHVFTLLFTYLWATRLEEHRRGHVSLMGLLWLVPLMLLWVNTHGAFIVGYQLIATYLVGGAMAWLFSSHELRRQQQVQLRDLALLFALSLLISAVHPSGFQLLNNSFEYLQQRTLINETMEYTSPDFHNPLFYPLLLLILLAIVSSIRRQITPTLLVLSWVAFSLYSFRNVDQLVIVGLPFLAESTHDLLGQIGRTISEPGKPRWIRQISMWLYGLNTRVQASSRHVVGGVPSAIAVILVATALMRGVHFDFPRQGYGFMKSSFPISAVQNLKPFPPGQRVFNYRTWGGYLSFCCWPQIKTFIDGQSDFYGPEHWIIYHDILDAKPGWEEQLKSYGVDWVIITPTAPLAQWLAQDSEWSRLYLDTTAIVFKRR